MSASNSSRRAATSRTPQTATFTSLSSRGNTDELGDQLNREGVDYVHTVNYGEEFNHDIYVQATEALFTELDPEFVLLPNSVNGLDYAPAVAPGLDFPYVSDAVGLDYDSDGLEVTREMYGSKVETTIQVAQGPYIVSVRGGEWPEAGGVGDAISEFDFTPDEDAIKSTVTGYEEVDGGDIDISEANFLVSIGRGIEEEDNLPIIEELVGATGATLSASRPIVDNEWLPKNRQVGSLANRSPPGLPRHRHQRRRPARRRYEKCGNDHRPQHRPQSPHLRHRRLRHRRRPLRRRPRTHRYARLIFQVYLPSKPSCKCDGVAVTY